VTAITRDLLGAPLWRWSRHPAAWTTTADIFFILVALSLPWSTSLVAIFVVAALAMMAPSFDRPAFLQSLRRPASMLPVLLFVVALVGTLWSDVPWGARLYAVGPSAKLLMVPVLLYHFERSSRAVQVFMAFMVSCVVLMAMSWLVAFDPHLALKSGLDYGVPIKNYIDQSQEFALCAVVLAYPVVGLFRSGRIVPALLLGALALSFVVNMAFVVVSRTALVTIPVMLAIFALLHLGWRSRLVILCAAVVLAGLAFSASPKLRLTIDSFSSEYNDYQEQNLRTSMGLRLEFWKKSLHFIADAPLIGHGTGSIRRLFEQTSTGPAGAASAEVIANPHNQTLNVAVQWGALGVIVLYAMWLSHLMLFRHDGLIAWIGLMVVVQNFFTSLFNSHLFDFNEGWMYVLGVGIAAGQMVAVGTRAELVGTASSVQS
jgi:O-antigen ligase